MTTTTDCRPADKREAATPARATAPQTNQSQKKGIIIRSRIKPETPPPAPPSGKGVHGWEWNYALWAKNHGLTPQEAARGILAYDGSLHRSLNHKAVHETVEKVYATSKAEFDPIKGPTPREPDWNQKETGRIHLEHPATAEDLAAVSPVNPSGLIEREVLRLLFPDPDGLLCLGRGKYYFYTGPLRGFPYLGSWEFIVAAYMCAQKGKTTGKDGKGKLSYHTKANTGPRRFIVFDFDDPPPEQHPSIIMHLKKFRPLVMALSTGGKGLHAWFPSTDRPGDDDLFWRLGITLGTDPRIMRNPSQFVRLPLGTRTSDNYKGNHQAIHYFNPEAIPQ